MRAIPSPEQLMMRETAQRLAASMAVVTPGDLETFDRGGGWASLVETGLTAMRIRDDGTPLATGYEASLAVEAVGGQLSPLPLLGHLLAQELLGLCGAECDDAVYALSVSADLNGIAEPGEADVVILGGGGAGFIVSLAADGTVHRAAVVSGGQKGGADLTRPFLSGVDVAGSEAVGRPLSVEDRSRWTAFALSMVCADMVGVMRAGLTQAVEYVQTRVQYDQPIGSFQAVQHMCADMLVQAEASASATQYAAWAVDVLPASESLMAARTAKAACAGAGRVFGETLMQVYGGIGQTWEHVAHLRARRLLVDGRLLGGEAEQLLQIADVRMGAA